MAFELLKYLLTLIIGALFSAFVCGLKFVYGEQKKNDKKAKAVEEAVQILLGAELTRKMQLYIKANEISTEDYAELEKQLKVYEALDGDGTVHKLWEAVGNLYIY